MFQLKCILLLSKIAILTSLNSGGSRIFKMEGTKSRNLEGGMEDFTIGPGGALYYLMQNYFILIGNIFLDVDLGSWVY